MIDNNLKEGDIIRWCDEYFKVIKNFGTSGTVVQSNKDGSWIDDIEISNFYWSAYGENSRLIKR